MALIAHTKQASGGSDYTTPAINTTGANLLVVWVSVAIGTSVTISDNKANTWTALTRHDEGTGAGRGGGLFYYAKNPTVGAGHTVTVVGNDAANGGVGACVFSAFSGMDTTAPADTQNGFGDTALGHNTIQPGSLPLPSADGDLIVAGWMIDDPVNTTWTINLSFTMLDINDVDPGNNYGAAMAYLIQGTKASINPTFTRSNATTSGGDVAAIASFKAAATGNKTVTPTGFSLSVTLGTPIPVVTIPVAGVSASTALGTPTPTTQTTVTVTPTGFALSMGLGTFTTEVNVTVTPGGRNLGLSLGTPTTSGGTSGVVVQPVGFSLSLVQGQIPSLVLPSPFQPLSIALGTPSILLSQNISPVGLPLALTLGIPKIQGATSSGPKNVIHSGAWLHRRRGR